MYTIPLFDLNFDEKEEQAVIEVMHSKWISAGPKTVEFEKAFARMLEVNYAVAVANCTVGLHLALKLAAVDEGDEVICPSLTFVATVNAIRYVKAIPVFADIRSFDDLTIDPDDIERKITSKTKAIMVMHYGGFACDMDKIEAIASRHKLKVIEDACHGPLSEYKGKKLGTIGDIGCFSFFSNKNISTGEGGMIVTNSSDYYERAKLLRSHGMTSLSYERAKGHSTNYDVIDLGYNYRMDDIHAAIGLVQLEKVIPDLKIRTALRAAYINELKDVNGIIIPFEEYTEFTSNYIFPIILESSTNVKRDKVRKHLADAGIQTSVHYPAVHKFSIYKEFYQNLTLTDYVADNMITLPMYSKLQDSDVQYITNHLRKVLNEE